MPLGLKKIVWWKVILGFALISIRYYIHLRTRVIPSAGLFGAGHVVQQFGIGIVEGVILVVGCCLVYSGGESAWNR